MPPDPVVSCDLDSAVTGRLVADLRQQAERLGFSRLGVTTAEQPPRHERLVWWVGQGLAGSMEGWLQKHLPLRARPDSLLEGARSVIMLATDYVSGDDPHRRDPNRGQLARYALGDDYHGLLRQRLNELGAWLERQVPGCRCRGVVDSAPLSERELAARAGLGWFGKNTMLIDPRAGSYFFLSGLLTTLNLPPDEPIKVDHCGSCTACLDACPTDALPEPRLLDANRCLSALTIEDRGPVPVELRSGFGNWVFGCDICQEVCPWNRHAPGTAEPALQPSADGGTLSLLDLLALDATGFRARFRGTPLLRAKRQGLLRSAAIAFGNHPNPEQAAGDSLEMLRQRLADDDPVIRGAVAWALGQWRRRSPRLADGIVPMLRRRLNVEADATVRSELEAALS